jgi:hypothetical protein
MRPAAGGRLRRQHAVRRAFTRLFLGFLQREFGPDSFRVERVTAPRAEQVRSAAQGALAVR